MHEEATEQTAELAFNEDLQDLHDAFLSLRDLWEEFERDHYKGSVRRDVNAARRRARVVSIEIAKRLKEYRAVSNSVGRSE